MTISLAIEYRDQEKKRYRIPIATHHIFFTCWIPACRELELTRIPHFETGYPVIHLNLETLPGVMDELRRLKTFFVECADQLASECIAQFIIERIDRLLFEMGKAVENWAEIEYIRV